MTTHGGQLLDLAEMVENAREHTPEPSSTGRAVYEATSDVRADLWPVPYKNKAVNGASFSAHGSVKFCD